MTLKELAGLCGLSVSTVSKALNNYSDVNEETRRMVQEKAREFGYKPNSMAQSLRSGRTYNIGVLYVDAAERGLTHSYFSPVLDAFKNEAESCGYDITFINRRFGNREATYLEHCLSRHVDGVCVVCCPFEDPMVVELLNGPIPIVTIDYMTAKNSCVRSDNAGGMDMIMQNVLAAGHRRIAMVFGEAA